MTPLFSKLLRGAGVLALVAGIGITQAAPPLPGAIFTTLSDGSRVNANIYSAKCDGLGVYLDGGPGPGAPQFAAGLPDGDYYYQVTDPSGKTLLSTDAQKYRRFTVTLGIITARVTPAATGDHQTGVDLDHGALTIELCPFLDTPNNGGEYKVWATPVGDFAGNAEIVDNGYNPGYFHGFIPAASKTDNFKIRARTSVCLTIEKFWDGNKNGRLDAGEFHLWWPVRVYDALGTQVEGLLWTGSGDEKVPTLRVCALPAGNYTVVEESSNGVDSGVISAVILDGKYLNPASTSVVVKMGTTNRTLTFLNILTTR